MTDETILQLGDRLYFTGNFDCINDLMNIKGLIPSTQKINMTDITNERVRLVEVSIPETSSLVNQTVKSARFRNVFGSVVVAIRRNDVNLEGHLGSIRLKGGDNLVMITTGEPDELASLKDLHVFNSQRSEVPETYL